MPDATGNMECQRSDQTLQFLAQNLIYSVRGQNVILDADVADFFERSTSAINQQRSRNADRFPEAYAFELAEEEWENLISQFVISRSHGGRRKLPWAYTEHGFTMLATRLRGERAAHISRIIVDTFVRYRQGTLPVGRVLTGPAAGQHRYRLQEAIYAQMESLLTMDWPSGEGMADEVKSISASFAGQVKALLERPGQENAHIVAQIRKLEAEAAKLFAEARKTDAEGAHVWIEVCQKRLGMLGQLRAMAAQLDRDAVLETLDHAFGGAEAQASVLAQPDQALIAR